MEYFFRLNQKKRFDLAKKQLIEKVRAETEQEDVQKEQNEKDEIEDDLDEINEDNMIYFG